MRAAPLLAVLVVAAHPAAAQGDPEERVLDRVVLPIDGRGVDLERFVPPGRDPIRVVLTGTLSSRLDGSEMDAMSRWEGDVQFDAEGPFVVLPPGSEVLTADPVAHRYAVSVPRGADSVVALDLMPLAARHLVTPSELRAGITGAIEMEILAPPPGPVAAAVESARVGARGLTIGVVAATAAVPALALVGLFAFRRRRYGPADERLLRRCRVAVRAVEREAARLGPAFDEVVAASTRMLDGATDVRDHYRAAGAAEHRTRAMRSEGAAAQKKELRSQRREALARLAEIASRLEETATELAAHGANQRRARHVDDLVRELLVELGTAKTADEEANEAA